LDPEQTSWRGWTEITLRSLTEDLSKTQQRDETGLTTYMMLCVVVQYCAEQYEYTGDQIITGLAEIQAELKDLNDMWVELRTPECIEEVRAFQDQLRDAAKHYGAYSDDLEKLIANEWSLSQLRRDAFHSLHELREMSFMRGQTTDDPPQYNKHVVLFFNPNSMLSLAAEALHTGISLALIRDPDDHFSYFAFIMRNGANIFALTDIPDVPHPAYKKMTRRPEREFSRRAEQHWFPYELLVSGYDSKGYPFLDKPGIVPYQKDVVQLQTIASMKPEQILWTLMLFELVRDRYWHKKQIPTRLHYTGEMVLNNLALRAACSNLPVKRYRKLDLPRVTLEDIDGPDTKAKWDRDPTGLNNWIRDRFADKVPEDVFNLVAVPNGQRLLTSGEDMPKDLLRYEGSSADGDDKGQLRALDPMSIGTAAELRQDQLWAARYNQALVTNHECEKEFKRREKQIRKWFKRHAEANKQAIVDAVVRGEWIGELETTERVGGVHSFDNEIKRERGNLVHERYLTRRGGFYPSGSYNRMYEIAEWRDHGKYSGRWHCGMTGERARVVAVVSPETPDSLAQIVDMNVEDLPDVLQHWHTREPYIGNSILSRIDPMEWVVRNPWLELRFRVGVALSLRYFKQRLKHFGLPMPKLETWEIQWDEDHKHGRW
jgi:hypothetical protein